MTVAKESDSRKYVNYPNEMLNCNDNPLNMMGDGILWEIVEYEQPPKKHVAKWRIVTKKLNELLVELLEEHMKQASVEVERQ